MLESLLEKKLQVLAQITQRLEAYGVRPVLVGGTALELYTAGAYATADMDLVVADRTRTAQVLQEMGFQPYGRHWFHPDWDVAVEIPDTDLAGDYAGLLELELSDGSVVFCIGIEDLVIDRLNAAVHRRSVEDSRWVRELLHEHATRIDWHYLRQRAEEEGTVRALEDLRREVQGEDASNAVG
ncbi:MAG: nucleotidyltransferase [Armatimonadota bacterium]|nr:nucleotidyltransferase [Armatimonadota bacterium]